MYTYSLNFMTFLSFISKILPKDIIIFLIILNIFIGSLCYSLYKENYYSEIEIESTNTLNLLSIFNNELLDEQNFNDWLYIYKTELSYDDFNNIKTIDNKYQFITENKTFRLIEKDKYNAYKLIFKKDQYYIPYDFFEYLKYIKNEILKNKITYSNLSMLYFLGFETKEEFTFEEKSIFVKDYINQNLIIHNPTEPKINGLNKLITTLLFLSLINLFLIFCLLIFNMKLVFRLLKN